MNEPTEKDDVSAAMGADRQSLVNERIEALLKSNPRNLNRSCSSYCEKQRRRRSSLGKVVTVCTDSLFLQPPTADDAGTNSHRSIRISSLPTTMNDSADHASPSSFIEEIVRKFTVTQTGQLKNIGDTRRRSVRKGSIISNTPLNDGSIAEKIEAETIDTGDGVSREINVHHVCIAGMPGTGKKSLLKQFGCSEYNGIYRFDSTTKQEDMNANEIIPVVLEKEESRLQFFIVDVDDTMASCMLPKTDSYLLVYDISKMETFDVVVQILHRLSFSDVVILVGNKTDLVRKRVVSKKEAQKMAKLFMTKQVETSVALNQNIDLLLAGTVKQIRLAEKKTVRERTREYMKKRSSLSEIELKRSFRSRLLRCFACGRKKQLKKTDVSDLFTHPNCEQKRL